MVRMRRRVGWQGVFFACFSVLVEASVLFSHNNQRPRVGREVPEVFSTVATQHAQAKHEEKKSTTALGQA